MQHIITKISFMSTDSHMIKINTSNLEPGAYLVVIEFINENNFNIKIMDINQQNIKF